MKFVMIWGASGPPRKLVVYFVAITGPCQLFLLHQYPRHRKITHLVAIAPLPHPLADPRLGFFKLVVVGGVNKVTALQSKSAVVLQIFRYLETNKYLLVEVVKYVLDCLLVTCSEQTLPTLLHQHP